MYIPHKKDDIPITSATDAMCRWINTFDGGGAGVSPYEVTGLTPEPGQPAYRQRAVTYMVPTRPTYIAPKP